MSSFDCQTAAYDREHRRFLLQLSEKLTTNDSSKIVFLEELPKELEEKSPLDVLKHLMMLGKTSTEELTRILKDISRQDLVKKVIQKEAKNRKAPLTRKDSGSSAMKLEESLAITIKNCEILLEQLEYLKVGASKGGKKRIEEIYSDAKEKLSIHVHRKLKYVSGLLTSEGKVNEGSQTNVGQGISQNSPQTSPENSLTLLRGRESPPSPVCPCRAALVKESDLRKGLEKLKSPKQTGT